jgi:hypothetical protein
MRLTSIEDFVRFTVGEQPTGLRRLTQKSNRLDMAICEKAMVGRRCGKPHRI